ncbi:unnamed protein product [Paramecium sonneborni]|uniref:Myosin motor domain-containing protein n=1 Tax=Paramecium sonneborni TaxID=65129 RepID=A0A8S1QV94_9CILI|nr:unnamed protein product [Paramecium sonneborni]
MNESVPIQPILQPDEKINVPFFNQLPNNIADISNPSQQQTLELLENAFNQKQIYLELGNQNLILLNPFEDTQHLNDKQIQNCKQYFVQKNSPSQYPPHIFKFAELAQQSCFSTNNKNNTSSIVTQGISGSGKSETSKSIISYLASWSKSGLYISTTLNKVEIEQGLISSNIIYEAFGNAKTKKNANSSRFGKIVSIQFEKGGKISGTKITTTLFERTRVTQLGFMDRNYHIFYQLKIAYERIEELKNFAQQYQDQVEYDIVQLVEEITKFQLDSEFVLLGTKNQITSSSDVQSINQSDLNQINQDFENFKQLLISFGDLDFSLEDIVNILQCVAGLIHLEENNYEKAEELLKISNLKETIDSKITNLQQSKKLQAESIVDGIIMDFYYKLFCWIQNKINKQLFQDYDSNKKFILNIFDSFGFEVIENKQGVQQNQLEQLMLNYVNEKLQNYFYLHIIENAENAFISENLTPIPAKFEKNDKIISLIEEVIFKSLKDCHLLSRNTGDLKEIITKQSQEKNLKNILIDEQQLKTKKQALTSSQNIHKFEQNILGIRHTGGEVYYQVDGFLSRNKYSVSENLQNINKLSQNSIINSFELQSQNQTVADNTLIVCRDMIDILKKSDTWFVKCFQTNYELQPNNFDQNAILTQLKYSGIDQIQQFLSQTYYQTIPNEEFFNNYQILNSGVKNLQELMMFINEQFQEIFNQSNVCQIYQGSKNILIKDSFKKLLVQKEPFNSNDKQLIKQMNEQKAYYEKAIKLLNEKLQISEKEAIFQKQRADNFEANQNQLLSLIQQMQNIFSQVTQFCYIQQFQQQGMANNQPFEQKTQENMEINDYNQRTSLGFGDIQ